MPAGSYSSKSAATLCVGNFAMCASVREQPASGKCDDLQIGALESIARRIPLPFADTQLWCFPLNLNASDLNRCALLLSAEEISRAVHFKLERDKNRYTAGRGMLRVLLGKYVGVSPRALNITAELLAKPILPDQPRPVDFNLSHADDCALVAISSTYEVGVDLENPARDVDYDALALRFFSAREQAELQRIPQAERRRAFVTCWTRKEAVAKALGQGLRMPLETIEVTIGSSAQAQLLSVPTSSVKDWTLHNVNVGAGFVATLALRRRQA
jgi:4'-phosphopantetheinyl transferase